MQPLNIQSIINHFAENYQWLIQEKKVNRFPEKLYFISCRFVRDVTDPIKVYICCAVNSVPGH